jgi:hypothetical protein
MTMGILHLQSADRPSLDAYANQLDAVFADNYSDTFGNLAAKANPNDPTALWALDISNPSAYGGDVPGAVMITPTELSELPVEDPRRLPFPVGATPFQWSSRLAGWGRPIVGP